MSTRSGYSKTVAELFNEQITQTSSLTAVCCENTNLLYQELNERANQL